MAINFLLYCVGFALMILSITVCIRVIYSLRPRRKKRFLAPVTYEEFRATMVHFEGLPEHVTELRDRLEAVEKELSHSVPR